MCFKPTKAEDRAKARERLAKQQDRPPTEVSRRPGERRELDVERMRRAEERLLSVVGN